MEKRRLGSLQVSVIGLGCNQLGSTCDDTATAEIINAALDEGITFLDTAEEYGLGASEAAIGKALKGRRHEVVIATKFAGHVEHQPVHGRAKADAVLQAAEESLRRLQTDYIDLYQLHFPDPVTPIEETLSALDQLVRAGKVREIGCCHLTPPELDEAAASAGSKGLHRFASNQIRLNLLRQESLQDVVPACIRHGMGVIPYFPLASSLLTGKYRRGEPLPAGSRMRERVDPAQAARMLSDRTFDQLEALEGFAKAHGHTLPELALAWLVAQPGIVSVIPGATRAEQVAANAAAARWQMSPEESAQAAALAAAR